MKSAKTRKYINTRKKWKEIVSYDSVVTWHVFISLKTCFYLKNEKKEFGHILYKFPYMGNKWEFI